MPMPRRPTETTAENARDRGWLSGVCLRWYSTYEASPTMTLHPITLHSKQSWVLEFSDCCGIVIITVSSDAVHSVQIVQNVTWLASVM
eukprot:m.31111 g.31111  ORF g.31111 m.31111 type:complete len:88 (+) comp6897_c0_seq1:575-838(+)